MLELVKLLPALIVAVAINIATGMYFKIGESNVKFNKALLKKGLIKAGIACGSLFGFAYISTVVQFDTTAKAIVLGAIALYGAKALTNLLKIFGLDITKIIKK